MSDSVFETPKFTEQAEVELEDELDVDDDVDVEDELEVDEDESFDEEDNEVSGGTAASVLEFVAKSIVDDPDAVTVQAGEGRGGTKLSLHVAPGDMGRIIGKRGRVAQAVRTLVHTAAARDGADASVDIVD